MSYSGLFITLYDEKTLSLYLDKGVYGFLMKPVFGEMSSRSRHYAALADYACARKGTHIFFFLKRKIVYGGQALGSENFGSFFLNGQYSPMGRKENSELHWDESKRASYDATDDEGIFEIADVGTRCQPYLIMFEDKLGLKGKAIQSDQLYFELGNYGYPLPSNSIAGMSFCTLTPKETEISLDLLKNKTNGEVKITSQEDIELAGKPKRFRPEFGVLDLYDAFDKDLFVNEAHFEASILANPELLPKELRPDGATLCRQVPVSPFKPSQMDRADICYYTQEQLKDGTIPNVVLELKKTRVGKAAIQQAERYLKWLYRVMGDQASEISVYVLAPSFSCNENSISKQYQDQLHLIQLYE